MEYWYLHTCYHEVQTFEVEVVSWLNEQPARQGLSREASWMRVNHLLVAFNSLLNSLLDLYGGINSKNILFLMPESLDMKQLQTLNIQPATADTPPPQIINTEGIY